MREKASFTTEYGMMNCILYAYLEWLYTFFQQGKKATVFFAILLIYSEPVYVTPGNMSCAAVLISADDAGIDGRVGDWHSQVVLNTMLFVLYVYLEPQIHDKGLKIHFQLAMRIRYRQTQTTSRSKYNKENANGAVTQCGFRNSSFLQSHVKYTPGLWFVDNIAPYAKVVSISIQSLS